MAPPNWIKQRTPYSLLVDETGLSLTFLLDEKGYSYTPSHLMKQSTPLDETRVPPTPLFEKNRVSPTPSDATGAPLNPVA